MCVYMYMWIIGMLFTSQIDPAYPKLALLVMKFPLFLYSLSRWKVWPCASKCFEFRTESRNFLPIAKPSNPDASFPWTDLFNTDAEQSPGWIWTLCRTRAWANREPTVLLPDTKWAWSELPKETRHEECLQNTDFRSCWTGMGVKCNSEHWSPPLQCSAALLGAGVVGACAPLYSVPLVPKVPLPIMHTLHFTDIFNASLSQEKYGTK